jgi:hypothetical protein
MCQNGVLVSLGFNLLGSPLVSNYPSVSLYEVFQSILPLTLCGLLYWHMYLLQAIRITVSLSILLKLHWNWKQFSGLLHSTFLDHLASYLVRYLPLSQLILCLSRIHHQFRIIIFNNGRLCCYRMRVVLQRFAQTRSLTGNLF